MLTKRVNTFIYTVVIFAAVLLLTVFGFASNAMAAEGTDDEVEIYCTYTDEDGNEVCGDTLKAGTYDVGFYTKNVEKISVIEITATYDTDVVSIGGITDSISSMTSMGTVNSNGNFVIGYVSDGNYVAVDGEAQLIAAATVTFSQDCDAEDYIYVSENPNLTFIVADSTNGNYGDEFALVDDFDGYTQGTLTKMTCDVSPAMSGEGYDISGRIMIADTVEGNASRFGIVGITVDVLDASGDVISSDVTDNDGNYTLLGVPAGEYKVLVHGPTTVDRVVTLVVDGEKSVQDLGIVICDYDRNQVVNVFDLSSFLAYYSGDDYYVYADFDANGTVNRFDLSGYLVFHNKNVVYADVTL